MTSDSLEQRLAAALREQLERTDRWNNTDWHDEKEYNAQERDWYHRIRVLVAAYDASGSDAGAAARAAVRAAERRVIGMAKRWRDEVNDPDGEMGVAEDHLRLALELLAEAEPATEEHDDQ